jgi:hypothetical protein
MKQLKLVSVTKTSTFIVEEEGEYYNYHITGQREILYCLRRLLSKEEHAG